LVVGDFVLTNPHIKKTLDIMGLNKVFWIFDDEPERGETVASSGPRLERREVYCMNL